MRATAMILLEGCVLLVGTVLALRVLARRPVWMEVRAHPALALVALAGSAALLAVSGWFALAHPVVGHAMAGLVAVVVVAALWRARPDYGRASGLPPGSLGLGASLDAIHDPDFYHAAIARWGRVFKMSQLHQPVVCIADLDLAHDLLRREADTLAQSRWSFSRLVPGGYLEYMRGEPHRRYRGILAPAFAATDLGGTREVAVRAARQQLQAMATARGGVNPEGLLLPAAMAPVLQGIAGAGPAHPRFASLVSLVTGLITPMELFLPVPAHKRATHAALVEEFRALAREASPAGAPASALAALCASDPRALDDETVAGNLVLMVKEGSIMVRGVLRWVLKMRVDHPAWTGRLRALGGDEGALDDLTRRFVLETLRRYESRYLYRTATADVNVGPYRIPRGWLVRICVGEAHERADHFPDPFAFDPDRFTGDPLGTPRFAPFGHGDRSCVGMPLAVAVAQAFLRVAALEFDIEARADGPPWRINRHWGLWRPSQAWRVAVTPRGAGTPA